MIRVPALPLMASLLLAACANHPPPPDWLLTAGSASTAHAHYQLEGRDKLAEAQLRLAREAVARTGDATQMARIELHACAVQLASLQTGECPAFTRLAIDAGAAENAYADYLAARLAPGDISLLPGAQQQAWRQPEALASIQDPLARLVVAGALFSAGRLPPAGIQIAIETAAAQGWRRPLLAWLGLEQERLQRLGDTAAADAIARRIERVLGTP